MDLISASAELVWRGRVYNQQQTDNLTTTSGLEVEVMDGGNAADGLVGSALKAVSQCVRHVGFLLEIF